MAAEACPNIYLDTSSSNGWTRYTPGLTLQQVFRTAIDVAGADRLLFGTDSSFFPRGWHKAVFDAQQKAVGDALVPPDARAKIFGGNFQRLWPPSP
jgi:predicted TIM-barrel fold metal-dependent hydrolase